jgi:pimeloyl-ACP methyl ester carboxylesterase
LPSPSPISWDSVVGDIEDAGLGEIVIVGHSMAGLTVPAVVTKLGSLRVREMIFATAFVPPEGKALVDTITGLFARIAQRRAEKSVIAVTPAWMVRVGFLNGTSHAQRRFMVGKLYPESPHILAENVSRRGMPDDIPRTWILTLRDRALSVKLQRKAIDAIGGVQTIIEMATCHMLMVSEPKRLAEILIERCRLYA